jgi:hypothetical protein
VNPQNAHKYLKEFVRDGLLFKSESPQFTLYRINPKNPFLFKIFELYELEQKEKFYSRNITLGRRLLKYAQVLRGLSDKEIWMILLYGPATRGEWTAETVVDILTVSSAKIPPQKMAAIHEEAANLVRHMLKISSIDIAMDDVIQGFREKKTFFTDLWNERIILYNEFLFWQMIRESKFSVKI